MNINRETDYIASMKFPKFKNISFRTRIILIFCSITVVLVAVLARFSYVTVRETYLNQLGRKLQLATSVAANEVNPQHLRYLTPKGSGSFVDSYYRESVQHARQIVQAEEVFLFDKELKLLVSTDSSASKGFEDPILVLNRQEIQRIETGDISISSPFKGNDRQWYLWGFKRLDSDHWLGIRENAVELAVIERLSWVIWAIGMLGVALMVAGSAVLARTLAVPVDKLVQFSRVLEKGNWQAELPEGIHGELKSLGKAMDQMRLGLIAKQTEKEHMLAQIAHEIRNPLGGIELLAGLMEEDLKTANKNPEYARRIREEIASLKTLINNYLAFGRPGPAQPQWIDVRESIRQVKEVIQHTLDEKQVTLSCNGEACRMWFDPQHFKQILINLVTNSAQALNAGGLVTIRSGVSDNAVRVDVTDNGPGIAQEQIAMVFEPFFTTGPNGSGLGLSISRKLCHENKSTLTVENNPDGGCTFSILQEVKERS